MRTSYCLNHNHVAYVASFWLHKARSFLSEPREHTCQFAFAWVDLRILHRYVLNMFALINDIISYSKIWNIFSICLDNIDWVRTIRLTWFIRSGKLLVSCIACCQLCNVKLARNPAAWTFTFIF